MSHFFSESTEAMAMKLCKGPQLDVTQVLKHFWVATLPNTAARAQKLVKLVPVPMSYKLSLCPTKMSLCPTKLSPCPTNCTYVQQKCPQSKTGGRRPPQPASLLKTFITKLISIYGQVSKDEHQVLGHFKMPNCHN